MFIKVKCHSSKTWCGQTKSDLDFRELPIFSYKNLADKEEIGVGAFAVVFTAKLPDKSKSLLTRVQGYCQVSEVRQMYKKLTPIETMNTIHTEQ